MMKAILHTAEGLEFTVELEETPHILQTNVHVPPGITVTRIFQLDLKKDNVVIYREEKGGYV